VKPPVDLPSPDVDVPSPSGRGVVVGLAAATVLLYAVLALWACVTPPFRAPDEPQHVSTVLRLAYSHTYPAAGTAKIYPAVKGAEPVVGFHIVGDFLDTSPEHVASQAEHGPQTLRQLAGQAGPYTLKDFDQMTQHPPGYYAVMAVPTRIFGLIDDTPREAIFIMRLLSALLLIPLPYLAFRLTRSLGGTATAGLSAAFLPAGLPQLTHVGAAVNNDALIITLASLLVVQAVELARFGATLKRATWFGITYAAALLTKGMALPLVVLVVGAYLLAARREGIRSVLRPFAVTAAISCAGLAWWVANIVRFGTLQPDGYPAAWVKQLPHGTVTLHTWFGGFFDSMTKSFWLDAGWLEMDPPRWGYLTASVVLLLLIVVGFVRSRGRRGLFVLAQAGWIAVFVTIFQQSHAQLVARATLAGSQGRYLFVGATAMATALALALRPASTSAIGRRAAPRRQLPLAPVVPFVVFAVAVYGLARGLHHFYVASGWSNHLDVLSSWSPLRLRELGVLLAIAVIAAAVGAGALWTTRRDRTDPTPDDVARSGPVESAAEPTTA
jgi:4-amino-4-deoxy-L-arabinose transferase-like glycosyltransferase